MVILESGRASGPSRDINQRPPLPRSFPELFAAAVRSFPSEPAVISATGEPWSYRRLDEASDRLARRLRALGVGPDQAVGLCMERAPELILGLVAILKAGGVYLPLNPAHPDERLEFQLDDTGAPLVLVHGPTRERLEGRHRLVVDPDAPGEATGAPLAAVPVESLAYIIYTSGSTGIPKGVGVPHSAAMLHAATIVEDDALRPGERVVQFSSLSFDVSIEQMLPTLISGAAVVLRGEDLADPAEMLPAFARLGVTSANLPTAYWHQAVQGWSNDAAPPEPLRLRVQCVGGEAMLPEAARRWMALAGPLGLRGVRLINGYGPTETVVTATRYTVPDTLPPDASSVPIGRTLPYRTAYVIDRQGDLQPPGVLGELCLDGILARGYVNRPDLTAEKFVPNPFSGEPGARMYRTGDLVRQLPDGGLDYAGRIDRQVKIRGFRIEPGEVEAVLASHPAVKECAVEVREDRPGLRQLVGYVVWHAGGSDASVFPWLRERLPDYMIPAAFVVLEALPLTANGKVDRQALPAPGRIAGADEPEASSDPVAGLIAGVWAQVLGLDRVGSHDDFFALGGHSLLATQAISRLRELLGVEVPFRTLFEHPTVAGLARVVQAEALQEERLPPLVPAAFRATGERPPLSFSQQRLWVFDQLAPDSPVYNIPLAERLHGELAPALLSRVFAEVVRRHEALRTTFVRADDGQPVQVIAPAGAPPLPLVDLSGLADRDAEALRLAREEAWRPFDLATGPLLRIRLLRLDERDHLLLINLHHIVSDGWSVRVLLREVGALYAAFSQGRPSPLAELPVQYADYAAWLRSWLQGEVQERQLAWWKSHLAGAPQALDLPTDRPRPALQTYRGGLRRAALTAAQAEAVRALCRREEATPFMVLLAAWALLLGRHAGQDDLLVGSPIAGRNRQETEDLIGLFVNTLALRIRLAGASFESLVASVRSTALDAYGHQDTPFERLVESLVQGRDVSRAALVQVLFVLHNTVWDQLALPKIAVTPVPLDTDIAKLELDLALWDREDGFAGFLGYNADLFDAGTADRLLARFTALLEAAAAEPERPVAELPLLLPAERRHLLADWNATGRDYPRGLCLHQLFEAAVDRAPEAVALIDGAHEITYAELERRANQVARHLRRLGAGPETLVGICTPRTADMIAGLLGTLKAGAAYLSLDPAYPRERLAFMLEDAASPVVLTREPLLDRLAGSSAAAVCFDRDAAVLAAESPARLPASAGPGSLAYAIYTSGSTGRPKGVAIEHRSAVVLCHWARETFAAEDLAGMLASTSINFDLSVFEIFVPLAWGGTVILAENALALPQLPAAGRVTFVNTVPSAIAELVRSDSLPPSVRTVGLAGEPLKGALVERIYARPHVQGVYNLYGPSEDTTYSTWARIERGEPGVPRVEPTIGRPVANTELYLLAPAGLAAEPVPPGAAGEVYLGGAGLARGYLGRPDLTAERFLPDPFSGRPGARLYRVGDLGRLLPDGNVQFLGRVDHQVKIRGFRIELGEIEAALSRHPTVAEAVVLARLAPAGDEGDLRLVAYVEPRPGTTVSVADLRTWLRERLPAHFVPSIFVLLDALPRTPNGKVDRKALPVPDWSTVGREDGDASARGLTAPRDPVEEMITGVWERVLGVRGIEPHQSFFALGGHSLLATQVISRLRDLLQVEVPFRTLFEHPTVAGLARVVQEERRPAHLPPLTPGLFRTTGERPPLSFAQQRLWFLDQLDPDSATYNIPLAERLRGELSVELLARVFAEVVRRHEALRTTFAAVEGQPVQVIAPPSPPPLPVVDLSALPAAEREAQALRLAKQEAATPFDLASGPLLRQRLLRLDVQDHLLLITMSHIVSDGWSLGVLLDEVGELYAAFSQGRPSPLPELPVQYADFTVWQRSWFQGEVQERQLAYWKGQLADAPQVLELPIDRPRPPVQTYRGGSQRVALTAARTEAVHALCRREGVTPFMALLAAWALLLGRHAGQEDVLVGSPIAGRTRQEIEDLIGFFVNTLVLRVRTGQATFRELLAGVRATALGAYTHQDLPFERLVEELVPERDLSHAALIQVLFVFQNTPRTNLALPGIDATPVTLDADVAKLDLDLALWEGADGIEGLLGHNADLFDASTAERLLARFEVLLDAAAGDPATPLADLPLLLPAERQQMLVEWTDAPGAVPREGSFPDLFRDVARAFPEEPAVISAEGEIWSYRRLDEASERLARRLRTFGVGLDQAVGLCMERSPELILGVVAVLKAGGVYLPLNPAHPDDRLEFQLDDTGSPLVLVHARTRERLQGRRRLEVDPDSLDEGLDEVPGGPLEPVPVESLAYVIYTSGSTGIPKGVGVPHGDAMIHSATIAEDDALRPGERVVQFSSLSFDVSIEQMLPTLISGAAVVLRGEELANPAEMLPAFARLGVTSANLPTAYWHQAVQGWSEESVPAEPLRLRVQCVGGEAMLPEAARRWMALAGPLGLRGVRLINGYGPTETVVTATRFTVPDVISPGASSVPIGRTLPFRAAYVVSAQGDLQPLGVLGELCLGGVMARGYVNRPALTAEKFVPNPFTAEPGARMYRTGDLVRQLPGGEIDYFGRIDRQVKIRGFRIEPGEIEAVLSSHPAVAECAVIVREDRPGSRLLAAYVVLEAELRDCPAELRSFLGARLPDYMVPAAFVVLDALPLTANGKLDRKALPAPERLTDAEGPAAPSDPVEELIAGIWAQMLDLDRVGVRDDFFALGGHSLLATQVASRLRTVLGVELPLRKLFEARTVADLATAVRAARQEGTAQAPPLTRRPADTAPPLSFGQQRFWFLERLAPGTPLFNIPVLYTVHGPLDAGTLQQALAEIVRRHETLRTTIAMPDGQAFQRVHPPTVPGLPVIDLSALPADLQESEARRVTDREAGSGFAPERGPLVRFLLLRVGAAEHRFLATFHHLITDGLSMPLFERELLALYEAFSAGRPSPLPELPVQYGDYALWQRGTLTGAYLADQVAFWRRRLAPPLGVLRLPTDHPRPEVPSVRGGEMEARLPRELANAVRELARTEGSTLYITLLAAFFALLHRATGQRDLVLGTPVSVREHANVDDLIGLFVNTLVIRAAVEPGATFRALLAHVRERVLEAFDHREVPFERLVEELQPERGPNDPPFFQLMFALLATQEKSLRAGGLELRPAELSTRTAQFELTLYMVDAGEDLVTQVGYRAELFDRPTLERLLAAWQALLDAATAAPDRPLAELAVPAWVPEVLHPVEPTAAPAAPTAAQADAAREAQLTEMKSQLSDEQKDRLKERLQRLKRKG